MSKLTGDPPDDQNDNQVNSPRIALDDIKKMAREAFVQIQPAGSFEKAYNLISQDSSEPFTTFVDRVIQAAERQCGDDIARPIMIWDIIENNASPECKRAIKALGKERPTVPEMIDACNQIGSPQHVATIQANELGKTIGEKIERALTAQAAQAETRDQKLTEILAALHLSSQQQDNTMAVMQATVTSGPCYFCKRPGHIMRNCLDIKRGVQAPDRCSTWIWLICGDRAWQGIPSKTDGGPCAMGQLTIIAPSVKKVVKKKSRRIRSSWGHQYESNCDSDFHPWNSGESIVASIFLPQLSSSIALKQLNKLGCWLSKEVNATSTMISDLLTDEEAIRHATLQNRAAIDYLLLAHGHGCEDFEGLFSYPEIAPILSLTYSFYTKDAQIRIVILLGSVIMVYKKLIKILEFVLGKATILDGTEARHLGSLSHDPVIDQEMMREASPCSLWERVLGSVAQRYLCADDLYMQQTQWKTIEQGIQRLREMAVAEIVFSDDINTRNPDLVPCTPVMWRKLVRLGPQEYSSALAIMKRDETEETVLDMAKKLRTYADAVHGPTHARIAALETRMRKLEDKMEENHKELKQDILQISAVQVRGSGTTRKRSLDREGKGIPRAKLWVLLRECGENMKRWDGESTDAMTQRLHELLDGKTMRGSSSKKEAAPVTQGNKDNQA
ncbi:hypothetical protein DUI87_13378 [Hirundo rustica rustica]|uniref:CCHC-type domain-containing protein n=1 Tax=Hirundo rustica rustica TaxID=333673 RepID=A0A3M0K923_HIRRU|nr:hypothetical protein DUI87_13378 [Hirundo rustica rustica]